jgi:hypothetical protein
MPTVPGTYKIEVWPYAGDPNSGKGGAFYVDLSTGPVGSLPPTNTPPSVSISSPTSGVTVSGTVRVQITASDAEDIQAGSLQVDLAVDGGAWQGTTYNASAGYYEFLWDTTRSTNGAHSLQARATDSGSASALSSTVGVTVSNPQSLSLHIGDLDRSAKLGKNSSWTATVTIEVHDGSHVGVQGVKLTGSWAGLSKTGSCRTGSNGVCSISSPQLAKNITSTAFTVTAVSKSGYGYDTSANHDPDGDSNGTSITVPKP